MYQVTTTAKLANLKPVVKTFNTFRAARKWYNDYCMFSFGRIETEIEEGTILGWSDNEHTKIEFEKLNQYEKKAAQALLF